MENLIYDAQLAALHHIAYDFARFFGNIETAGLDESDACDHIKEMRTVKVDFQV